MKTPKVAATFVLLLIAVVVTYGLTLCAVNYGIAQPILRFIVDNKTSVEAGIGFGVALAIVISWSVNKSILWAMLHGFLSWIYVIYYAVTR